MAAESRQTRPDVARLAWAFRRSRRSQVFVERAVGAAPGTLSQLLRGKRSALSTDLGRRLAAVLDVSASWLILGEGAAFWRVKLVGSEPAHYVGRDDSPTPRAAARTWRRLGDARALLHTLGRAHLVIVGAYPPGETS